MGLPVGFHWYLVERRGIPLLRPLWGLRSRPLAGLVQAGFDHRLLERSLDVLAYADALTGSIPLLLFRIILKDGTKPSFNIMVDCKGMY